MAKNLKISSIKVDFYFENDEQDIFLNGTVPIRVPEENQNLDAVTQMVRESLVDYLNGDNQNEEQQYINLPEQNVPEQNQGGQQNQNQGGQTQDAISPQDEQELPERVDGQGNDQNQDLSTQGIQELGGGWFQLPNGDKVQGEDNARSQVQQSQNQTQQTGQPQQNQNGGGLTDEELGQRARNFNQNQGQQNPASGRINEPEREQTQQTRQIQQENQQQGNPNVRLR